jgi:hypothetical protein
LICYSQSTNGERKNDAASAVKNRECLRASLFTWGQGWANLYRFENRLTRPKSSSILIRAYQAGIIILPQALKSCINTNPFQIMPAINV